MVKIYAYDCKGLRKIAKDHTPVISALALGPDGTIYCGTVADGRVLSLDPRTGSWKQVAQLGPGGKKGEVHVWALAWDQPRKRLYAGTGPRGELYVIDETISGRAMLNDFFPSLYVSRTRRLFLPSFPGTSKSLM